MWDTLKLWDRELLVFLNNLGSEPFDAFWIFVTQIESWTPLFLFFFGIIFYNYKTRKGLVVFIFLLITFGITLFLTDLTKEFVERLRPNQITSLTELIRSLQNPPSYSFFSGHASSSFAITTFIICAFRSYSKWIYLTIIWPMLFTFSRIYIGVHYPSDLMVGALIGTIIAFVMFKICKKILDNL